jgi:hypothetical protein
MYTISVPILIPLRTHFTHHLSPLEQVKKRIYTTLTLLLMHSHYPLNQRTHTAIYA